MGDDNDSCCVSSPSMLPLGLCWSTCSSQAPHTHVLLQSLHAYFGDIAILLSSFLFTLPCLTTPRCSFSLNFVSSHHGPCAQLPSPSFHLVLPLPHPPNNPFTCIPRTPPLSFYPILCHIWYDDEVRCVTPTRPHYLLPSGIITPPTKCHIMATFDRASKIRKSRQIWMKTQNKIHVWDMKINKRRGMRKEIKRMNGHFTKKKHDSRVTNKEGSPFRIIAMEADFWKDMRRIGWLGTKPKQLRPPTDTESHLSRPLAQNTTAVNGAFVRVMSPKN